MTLKIKEIIRDIKLYELGIKDKPDGYDTLMSLRGLNPFKTEDNEEFYGKANDIKFKYNIIDTEYIYLDSGIWDSIEYSFKISFREVQELTMWAIGSDSNLEGVPTCFSLGIYYGCVGTDPI